jgi:hypothetical protein
VCNVFLNKRSDIVFAVVYINGTRIGIGKILARQKSQDFESDPEKKWVHTKKKIFGKSSSLRVLRFGSFQEIFLGIISLKSG